MGQIVKLTDFEIGPNSINSNSYQDNDLNACIDTHEKAFLIKILGPELADLYLANVDAGGTPSNPDFIALNDPLTVFIKNRYVSSTGIKSILKGFIRAEWVKELQLSQFPTGVSITKSENSTNLNESYFLGFNEMVTQTRAVQMYCRQNISLYPTFKGVSIDTINPLW